MPEVQYRTHVAALLATAHEKSALGNITIIDKRRTAAEIGVSPTTFYDWWNADESSEDFKGFLEGYNAATEWKFKIFFAKLLDLDPEEIKVVEAVVDPRCQESVTLVAVAA